MKVAALLKQQPDGSIQGSIPLIPGVKKQGSTREQVLKELRQELSSALTKSEWVYLDVEESSLAPKNPWLENAGIFAEDSTLEPMLEEIYAARKVE